LLRINQPLLTQRIPVLSRQSGVAPVKNLEASLGAPRKKVVRVQHRLLLPSHLLLLEALPLEITRAETLVPQSALPPLPIALGTTTLETTMVITLPIRPPMLVQMPQIVALPTVLKALKKPLALVVDREPQMVQLIGLRLPALHQPQSAIQFR
jgi:hypothetical protein